MLTKIPRHLPTWAQLTADLGEPAPGVLAKALDVHPRTLVRWRATQAPRTAALALYWLSSWGESAVVCEALTRADLHQARADALAQALVKTEAQLSYLNGLHTGAANQGLVQPPAAQPLAALIRLVK